MLRLATLALTGIVCASADDIWLRQVSPVMTGAERARYLSLSQHEQTDWRSNFWTTRTVTPEAYFSRLAYVDATYGSGALLSGTNTDRGRMYLALGAPNRTARLPSSRTFVPMEIWYYDEHSWQFLFFTKREGSEPRLYSPSLDTVRALLLPTSSNRSLFPSSDVVTGNDIRNRMTLSPTEEEVVEPAMRVSRGITGLGNDEILALAMSPRQAINKGVRTGVRTDVRSRLLSPAELPIVNVAISAGMADVSVECSVRGAVLMKLFSGTTAVDETETTLGAASLRPVRYLHRYPLPPGHYTLRAECDRRAAITTFTMSDSRLLVTGVPGDDTGPFAFGGGQVLPSNQPRVAVAQNNAPEVRWRLSKGSHVIWSATATSADGWSRVELPAKLEAGTYDISADAISARFSISPLKVEPLIVSYRANLVAEATALLASRVALARGDVHAAREALAQAGEGDAVLIARARIQSLTGNLDEARALLEQVQARNARNTEALVAMGFISYEFQDYVMAERYLRKAIDINPSPALRTALGQVTGKQKGKQKL